MRIVSLVIILLLALFSSNAAFANGTISKVTNKSSELNNPKLERQLTLVLRSVNFPGESVAVMTTIWAIDFFPS